MTRLDALKKLTMKVEAGSIAKYDLDAFIPVFGLTTKAGYAHKAYNSDLQSVFDLHEAVLPGFRWEVYDSGFARVWKSEDPITTLKQSYAGNPTRAWLLAILLALIAQEESNA